jgi:xanthine/uracil permease
MHFFRMNADVATFQKNARALAICGVLLILLSLVPWVDHHKEIGPSAGVLHSEHFSSRVREFIGSDEFLAGSQGTTFISGYKTDRTFAIGDGVVLAGAATLLIVIALVCGRRTPRQRPALSGLVVACVVLVAIGFVAVFPHWSGEGMHHWERQGSFEPDGGTWFEVTWNPAWGVVIASLVLLFAATRVLNMIAISLRRP